MGDPNKKRNDNFHSINERPVDDISLEFFYKPHTITLLTCSILLLIYWAFTRNDANTDDNILSGLKALTFFFLVISVLAFPNGPFTRPHPAIWRMVFGLSVLYLIFLVFILFQSFSDVKAMLRWIDPENLNKSKLELKEYAVNCSQISLERFWSNMDIYAWAHFVGWAFKTLILRHYVICWYISVMWEFTEIAFSHLLPNFAECWWDILFLDILLCNGLGIWVGMVICRKLEMRTYHWESIKTIPNTRGKIKRAVMQFTPSDWTVFRWLDPNSTPMRLIAVWQLVVVWQMSELNTFFLKHIFAVETGHVINLFRLLLIGAVGAPSMCQFYCYVTDPRCKRVGTQCWVYGAMTITEMLICIKFGWQLFAQSELLLIGGWLFVLLITSGLCVYISIVVAKWSSETKPVKVNGEVMHRYIDSSAENLTELPDDTRLRRRRAKQLSESSMNN